MNRRAAVPTSSGDSSCRKCDPLTVTVCWLGHDRQNSLWAPMRKPVASTRGARRSADASNALMTAGSGCTAAVAMCVFVGVRDGEVEVVEEVAVVGEAVEYTDRFEDA